MEWVETTGKTIAEAKEKALDQLGVHHEDAEFDVLEEPKQGLFGRVRGEARVRARVRPAQARQKMDRRDRKRAEKAAAEQVPAVAAAPKAAATKPAPPDGAKKPARARAKPVAPAGTANAEGANAASPEGAPTKPRAARAPRREAVKEPSTTQKEQTVDAAQVGEEARRFVADLVAAFGLSGTTELVEDGDELEVRVHGEELGLLVGPRGTTLQAVQDLTRVAAQRRLGDHDTRLRVDVASYRERRRAALARFATQMADEVKASAVARVLEPMSAADRKVIHDTLSGVDGIVTRSEGDDPQRRVIIAPAND